MNVTVVIAVVAAAVILGVTTLSDESSTCEGYVALTFDDGPHPGTSRRILAVLERHHARATFFNVGREERKHPQLVEAEQAAGHWFGNHSYTHPDLTRLPRAEVVDQLLRASRQHRAITGHAPRLFRPPYGYSDRRIREAARDLGMVEALWTVETVDWAKGTPVQEVIDRALEAESGGIVVMHDHGNERTVDALPTIIEELRRKRLCPGKVAPSRSPQKAGPLIHPVRDIYVRAVAP